MKISKQWSHNDERRIKWKEKDSEGLAHVHMWESLEMAEDARESEFGEEGGRRWDVDGDGDGATATNRRLLASVVEKSAFL